MRRWKENRERILTDEESAGEGPFLGPADDGEGQPMGGNEGVKQRDGSNPSHGGDIGSAKSLHLGITTNTGASIFEVFRVVCLEINS